MLCYRCGSLLPDDSETCLNCGHRYQPRRARGGGQRSSAQAKPTIQVRPFHEKGEQIDGRYEIIEVIGGGGLGVVYRARDLEIDVDVALKFFDPRLFPDSRALDRFGKALRAVRRFSQPNIVRIYDVGQEGRSYFATMQLLEGLSLRQIIDLRRKKGQLFALPEIEPIVSQIALALQHAHQYTFHGNLKPDNVIVLPDLLKVTDFCLDRALPHSAYLTVQSNRGTLDYLAPEQRQVGGRADRRADVYSLGVILGEMLADRRYSGIPFNLTQFNSDVPPALDYVFRRAVHPAPAVRYPAIEDLAEDVLEILERGDLTYAYSIDDLEMAAPPAVPPAAAPPPLPGAAGPLAAAAPSPKPAPAPPPEPESEPEPAREPEPEAIAAGHEGHFDDSGWDEILGEDEEPVAVDDDLVVSEEEYEIVPEPEPAPEPVAEPESEPERHTDPRAETVAEAQAQDGDEGFSIDIDLEDDEEEEEEPRAADTFEEVEREAGMRTADRLGGEDTVARMMAEDIARPASRPAAAGDRGVSSDDDAPVEGKPAAARIEFANKRVGGVPLAEERKKGKRSRSVMPAIVAVLVIGSLIGVGAWYVTHEPAPTLPPNATKTVLPKPELPKSPVGDEPKEPKPEAPKPELAKPEEPRPEEPDPLEPVMAKPEEPAPAEEFKPVEEMPAEASAKLSPRERRRLKAEQERERKRKLEEKKRKAEDRRLDRDETRRLKAEAKEARRLEREEAGQRKDEEARLAAEAASRRKAEEVARVEPEEVAVAATGDLICQRGMVLVPAGAFTMGSSPGDPMRNFGEKANSRVELPAYCIDYYEYPNGRGLKPKTGVSWQTASKVCEKRGKRLCKEEEWEKACKGSGGRRYPYGSKFDAERCNTEDANGEDRQVAPAGTFRSCRSPYGLFDLSGNVSEWTDGVWSSTIRDRVQKGGAADRPDWAARCASRENHPPGSKSATVGFRCCATPQPK